MKIELTQGKVALVDEDVFEELSKHKWHLHGRYAARWMRVAGKRSVVFMHRQILGCKSDQQVDHKNGVTLDNRRNNLRLATPTQNSRNAKKAAGVSSRFKGVSWDKRRGSWLVQIQKRFIGRFKSELAAANAYDRKARELFGEFARLNEAVMDVVG